MSEDREARIRRRAEELWKAAGTPEGYDEEFWLRAEREIDVEDRVADQKKPP